MKLSLSEKCGLGAVLAFFGLIVSLFGGYFTNIFWLFSHMDIINGEFVLAALGVILFPLGALHGIWTWF